MYCPRPRNLILIKRPLCAITSVLIFFCEKTTVLVEKVFHPATSEAQLTALCHMLSLFYQTEYQLVHSFSNFPRRISIGKRPNLPVLSRYVLKLTHESIRNKPCPLTLAKLPSEEVLPPVRYVNQLKRFQSKLSYSHKYEFPRKSSKNETSSRRKWAQVSDRCQSG